MPMVTARMSRCSASIMRSVARSSSDSQMGISWTSYAVQRVDDVFVHHHRLQAHLLHLGLHRRLEVGERYVERGGVDDHDHGEEIADQGLRDVEDVAAQIGDARG